MHPLLPPQKESNYWCIIQQTLDNLGFVQWKNKRNMNWIVHEYQFSGIWVFSICFWRFLHYQLGRQCRIFQNLYPREILQHSNTQDSEPLNLPFQPWNTSSIEKWTYLLSWNMVQKFVHGGAFHTVLILVFQCLKKTNSLKPNACTYIILFFISTVYRFHWNLISLVDMLFFNLSPWFLIVG